MHVASWEKLVTALLPPAMKNRSYESSRVAVTGCYLSSWVQWRSWGACGGIPAGPSWTCPVWSQCRDFLRAGHKKSSEETSAHGPQSLVIHSRDRRAAEIKALPAASTGNAGNAGRLTCVEVLAGFGGEHGTMALDRWLHRALLLDDASTSKKLVDGGAKVGDLGGLQRPVVQLRLPHALSQSCKAQITTKQWRRECMNTIK